VSQIVKGQNADGAIARHLGTALASALSSMTGKEFSVLEDPKAEALELAEPIVWQQTFSFSEEPALWLMAGKDLWSATGRLTLGGVGVDSVSDEDCRSTWLEIAAQTVGAFTGALTGDLQQEVTTEKGDEANAVPENVAWRVFSATCPEESGWVLKVGWSASLTNAYNVPRPREKAAVGGAANFSRTFDLLLDVALPVHVSFGRTSLQIREVLKLNTGSIVELNRFVVEPVDVIVNDCVIARGEVVVVDGNYGVRITQLSSREDRLRTGMMDSPVRVGEPLR
jgi:flagellar motor switch protein FliN/FliY